MLLRHVKNFILSDITNVIRFGVGVPSYCGRIYVNPAMVKRRVQKVVIIEGKSTNISRLSGRVTKSRFWDEAEPVQKNKAIECSLRHWKDGLSWDESGEIDRMLRAISTHPKKQIAGCKNKEDVILRCDKLDAIYHDVKTEGQLRTFNMQSHKSILQYLFGGREPDGILVHLAQDGEVIFGSSGAHRLAMAMALDLPVIPAKIGLVHVSALSTYQKTMRV